MIKDILKLVRAITALIAALNRLVLNLRRLCGAVTLMLPLIVTVPAPGSVMEQHPPVTEIAL
jgi:hypothetical protein